MPTLPSTSLRQRNALRKEIDTNLHSIIQFLSKFFDGHYNGEVTFDIRDEDGSNLL